MRPFRFALNGQMFSKKDTYTILLTMIAALLGFLLTIFSLFSAK